ncbi:PREDICTED: golgin subfamily A member 6-like protein 22 isoform X2 [Vollenhovia emeryi]|uniref:golgin subfamily A member 6-like protein 22 isoform X2 n=1 Tax=Vollenhovia emeryi TaxID=411798 RepID=UPI0005F4F605|nr:PREDICTED: golgin subfamily A member 6-like protein 22 isoform X2 [Vollenhovia emeryi]
MFKKKKRGGDKEKKVRKKAVNERETVSYEQQILDNNRQLSRLRSRNEELEIEVKNLMKKFEQLKEDRSDVVAHLKRDLEGKIEEARELNERLLALEELRKQEQAEYKKRESAMEQEFRTMESNLSAEVKLAAGKLNALEDWRLARLDLMRKFEVQEEEMAKQEELHKTTLYETEKSVIVAKAKMQKDMEERLKQLAREFKEATNVRIADVMHNAVRRNIALNHELNSMLKVCQDLETQSSEYKETDRALRLQCELLEGEARIAQEDAMRHRRAMHELAEEHVDTILEYGRVQRQNARHLNYEQAMDEYKARCVESEERVKVLEQRLQETKRAREEVLKEVRKKCEEFDKLNTILNEAKQCVLEALQLQEHVCTSDVCTSCCADQKQKIIYSLQNILEKHNISDIMEDDDSQMEKTESESLG